MAHNDLKRKVELLIVSFWWWDSNIAKILSIVILYWLAYMVIVFVCVVFFVLVNIVMVVELVNCVVVTEFVLEVSMLVVTRGWWTEGGGGATNSRASYSHHRTSPLRAHLEASKRHIQDSHTLWRVAGITTTILSLNRSSSCLVYISRSKKKLSKSKLFPLLLA